MTPVKLTTREQALIQAIVAGKNNKEIASMFGVSLQTVKNQLSALYHKLGVGSRLQLAVVAMRDNLVQSQP